MRSIAKSLATFVLGVCSTWAVAAYPMVEMSLGRLPVAGNPFDYRGNDIRVEILQPDGTLAGQPAFYDGDAGWMARFTPRQPGKYTVKAVRRNGEPLSGISAKPASFDASGKPSRGFIRIGAADPMRLMYENGTCYYPIGYNMGWDSGKLPVPEMLQRAGAAGVNWSRIWMNHWDNKNLDWGDNGEPFEAGKIRLDVAAKWDAIVKSADSSGVAFQMVLQHHGQLEAGSGSAWPWHPWNIANGGWLEKPDDFFTDPKAIGFTKAKYRYIIARWGYSPSILAWELFNEVEATTAGSRKSPSVGAWHQQMAAFLRAQDPYRHLVTTSSTIDDTTTNSAIDYYQPHAYPSEPLAAIYGLDERRLDKPYFYGEIGPSGDSWVHDRGWTAHNVLWASLTSQASGAAQFWYWDTIDRQGLQWHYLAANRFIDQSGMLQEKGLKPLDVSVTTRDSAALVFGPGGNWMPDGDGHYVVRRTGVVDRLGQMASFLHGQAHRDIARPLVFEVDYPADGMFTLQFGEFFKSGAEPAVFVDERLAARVNLGPVPDPEAHGVKSYTSLGVPVSKGLHRIRVDNGGNDWVTLRSIELDPYAPAFAAHAKGNRAMAILWLQARRVGTVESTRPTTQSDVEGSLTIPMSDGAYQVTWWDTYAGKASGTSDVVARQGTLVVPARVSGADAAAFVRRK